MTIDKIQILRIAKIAVIVMFCVLIAKTVQFDLIDRISTEVHIYDFNPDYSEAVVRSGETREYEILAERASFTFLDVFLEDIYSGFQVNLLNDEGDILFERQISVEDMIVDDTVQKPMLRIGAGETFSKGNYILRISNPSEKNIRMVAVEGQEDTLNIRMIRSSRLGSKLAYVTGILLAGYGFAVWCLLRKREFEWQHFFLTSVIPLALVYMVVMAPWSAADSSSHYTAAYRFSSRILGCSVDEEWLGRAEDADFYRTIWRNANPSMRDYVALASDFKIFAEDKTLVEMPFDLEKGEAMKYYSILNYWPQILGLTLGRLLGLSAVLCVYLARICIMLFYISACYHAIKMVPVGKSIFALVPLLPIALVMSSAISYDSMVLPVSMNLVASTLALYKEPGDRKRVYETAVWAFMTGAVKGGGYLILLPLSFVLYNEKEKKKSLGIIAKIVLSGLVAVVLFDVILPAGSTLFQFGVEGNGKMTAMLAFRQPLYFVKLCMETYIKYSDYLILSMLGTQLSWVETSLPGTLVLMLLIVMGVAALFEKDALSLKKRDKWIFLFVILICVVFTPMMLLSWTDQSSDVVEGLQGRYYLPVLSLAMLVMTKFSFYDRLSDERYAVIRQKCAVGFSVLSCIVVYYMERLYLTR